MTVTNDYSLQTFKKGKPAYYQMGWIGTNKRNRLVGYFRLVKVEIGNFQPWRIVPPPPTVDNIHLQLTLPWGSSVRRKRITTDMRRAFALLWSAELCKVPAVFVASFRNFGAEDENLKYKTDGLHARGILGGFKWSCSSCVSLYLDQPLTPRSKINHCVWVLSPTFSILHGLYHVISTFPTFIFQAHSTFVRFVHFPHQ